MLENNKKCIFIIFIFINVLFYSLFENNQIKISIFIPIYNKNYYLKRSIGSLENQSLRNIEILAINDCSTDNSLKLLKTLSKEDKRIKIINNDRNHGLLYSRAMGILNSSGEYLMNLDPDDKLVSNNNLKLLYKTAKYKDFDFIMYKLKRIALNSKEKNIYDYLDEIQLNATDDHITNKLY